MSFLGGRTRRSNNPSQTEKCALCDAPMKSGGKRISLELCHRCDLAFFQIDEVLANYMDGNPPDWMSKAMMHVGWIFESYPRTAAFLNLATEVMFDFVIGEEPSLGEDDLKEFRHMKVSPNEVMILLEEAYLIIREDGQILPGRLIDEIKAVRITDYPIRSKEFTERIREVRGVLAVAITMGLLKSGRFRPQRPLTLFRILSQNILVSGLDDERAIEQTMSQVSFEAACHKISPRQRSHLLWYMSGFSSGQPYIMQDLNDKGWIVFDNTIIEFMERMRERYRERMRIRPRIR